MMMEELLNYCNEADKKIISVFAYAENIPVRAVAIFSHVLNAQHIWACRILQRKSVLSVSELHSTSDFDEILTQNYILFREILAKTDLKEEISYTNSSGRSYVSCVKDILFHVLNHSTYHRGQISMLFRDSGIEPPVTDYIFLKRDQNG